MAFGNSKEGRISLSIYSFGYSAGFIHDSRPDAHLFQTMTPAVLADFAKAHGLRGIEIPIDRYFKLEDDLKIEEFFNLMKEKGLNVICDLENFNIEYIQLLSKFLKDVDAFVRVKISSFYGGNRYKNKDVYERDLSTFFRQMEILVGSLNSTLPKILIENHQDVVVQDILQIINRFGDKSIGVNWDIGNSMTTGETPESFYEKLGKYIYNVHLKDYIITLSDEGYIMHRCELGRGIKDLHTFVNLIPSNIPISIELGAHNQRVADINSSDYWKNTKGISDFEKIRLINYLKYISCPKGDYRTPWEKKLSPEFISDFEMNEVNNSINYAKTFFS